MKKYFFFAAAALVALTACSKVELSDAPETYKKIGFEVANYARQTKANLALTNDEDGIFSFHTYAYQFPEIGTPRQFMNEDVFPWSNEATPVKVTSANFTEKQIGSWSPANDYYWPKTGYINFYSYAGTVNPTVAVNSDWKTVTFTYTDAVISATSNILVADAALHYGLANKDAANYQVDNSETSAHVTKGVPTLFHHQLAKVIFDVRARTTSAKVSNNTSWKVQVLGTHTYTPTSGSATTIKTTINPINKGTLVLTNVDDKTAASQKAWTRDETSPKISGWVPSSVATDKEEIEFTSTPEMDAASFPEALIIPTGAIESLNGTNPYDPVEILAARSVMPQLTENVAFTLVYKVQALHGDTVFMEEIRTVGIDAAADLADLANTVASWQANKKITYHIIIDPVSEKVTFDPAVEDYDSIDADGDTDEININQGGIVTP